MSEEYEQSAADMRWWVSSVSAWWLVPVCLMVLSPLRHLIRVGIWELGMRSLGWTTVLSGV